MKRKGQRRPTHVPWLAKTDSTSEAQEFICACNARVILALCAEYGVNTDIREDCTPWDTKYLTTRICKQKRETLGKSKMARYLFVAA